MRLRDIVAVVLGMILQITLTGVVPAAPAPDQCSQQSCCCSSATSCPCIESSSEDKPSLPVLPVQQERLTPLITPTDPEIPGVETRAGPSDASSSLTTVEVNNGYRGVPLAVAFCRFTI